MCVCACLCGMYAYECCEYVYECACLVCEFACMVSTCGGVMCV